MLPTPNRVLILAVLAISCSPTPLPRLTGWRLVPSPDSQISLDGDPLPTSDLVIFTTVDTQIIHAVLGPPVQIGDTTLVGLRVYPASHEKAVWAVTPSRGRSTVVALPKDAWPFFHDVSVSPSGAYLLYLAAVRDKEWARIVELSTRKVVRDGPSAPSCDCDVDLHHARWVTADTFQLATRLDTLRWTRVTGSVTTGIVTTDTLPVEPQWH